MIGAETVRRAPLLRASLAVGLLALVGRLAYFLIVHHHGLLEPDSADYIGLAHALAAGHFSAAASLASGGFPVDLNRPPGYPAFLVAANLGGHVSPQQTALVQVALGSLFAGGLTWAVGRWLGVACGAAAGILLALDWQTVITTPLVLSDIVFAMLYAGGTALLVMALRRRPLLLASAAGVVFGAASLVKPIGLVAAILTLIVVLISPRRNWRLLAALLGIALVAVPWAVRNQERHGVFTISSIGTVNLYAYTAQGALHSGYLFGTGGSTNTAVANEATAGLRRSHPRTAALYSRMTSDAVRIIEHHLPKVVVQELWGTLHVMLGTGKETLLRSTRDPGLPSVISSWIPLVQVLAMWLLGLIGIIEAWRRRLVERSALVAIVSAAALAMLAAGGPAGYGRYRLPATPIQCVLAGIGIVALSSRLRWLQRPALGARGQVEEVRA